MTQVRGPGSTHLRPNLRGRRGPSGRAPGPQWAQSRGLVLGQVHMSLRNTRRKARHTRWRGALLTVQGEAASGLVSVPCVGAQRWCRALLVIDSTVPHTRRGDPLPGPGDYHSAAAGPSGTAFTMGRRIKPKDPSVEHPGPGEYEAGEADAHSHRGRVSCTGCISASALVCGNPPLLRRVAAVAGPSTPAWTMAGRPKAKRPCKGKKQGRDSPGPTDYSPSLRGPSGAAFTFGSRAGDGRADAGAADRPGSYLSTAPAPSGPSFTMRGKPPLPRPPKASARVGRIEQTPATAAVLATSSREHVAVLPAGCASPTGRGVSVQRPCVDPRPDGGPRVQRGRTTRLWRRGSAHHGCRQGPDGRGAGLLGVGHGARLPWGFPALRHAGSPCLINGVVCPT